MHHDDGLAAAFNVHRLPEQNADAVLAAAKQTRQLFYFPVAVPDPPACRRNF